MERLRQQLADAQQQAAVAAAQATRPMAASATRRYGGGGGAAARRGTMGGAGSPAGGGGGKRTPTGVDVGRWGVVGLAHPQVWMWEDGVWWSWLTRRWRQRQVSCVGVDVDELSRHYSSLTWLIPILMTRVNLRRCGRR